MTSADKPLETPEQLKDVFLKVTSAMAMADDKLLINEIDVLDAAFQRFVGRPLKAWEVDEIALLDHVEKVPLSQYLSEIEGGIPDGMKDEMINAAKLVAAADGELTPKEIELLGEIAEALRVPDERAQSLLSK